MMDHRFDRGGGSVAAERTDLAWNRSSLALLACGAVVLKGFPPAGLSARYLVGAVILLVGALIWMLGAVETKRRFRAVPAPVTERDVLAVASGVTVAGAAIFVLAAFAPD